MMVWCRTGASSSKSVCETSRMYDGIREAMRQSRSSCKSAILRATGAVAMSCSFFSTRLVYWALSNC